MVYYIRFGSDFGLRIFPASASELEGVILRDTLTEYRWGVASPHNDL